MCSWSRKFDPCGDFWNNISYKKDDKTIKKKIIIKKISDSRNSIFPSIF